MAQVSGMPGYPFVVIAHPIAHNDDDILRQKAVEAVQQSTEILLKR